MEDIVRAAMARWPNVPAVYGWLQLNARGQWRIRGEPIGNAAIREFIGRNYGADRHGNWFFQNGPQRVYVELELAPLIIRLDGTVLHSHVGAVVNRLDEVRADEHGRLYFMTEHGPGALDDRDAPALAERLRDASGRVLNEAALEAWLGDRATMRLAVTLEGKASEHRVARIDAAEVPRHFGFRLRPQAVAA